MTKSIHLTDEQYLSLLKSARKHLDSVSRIQSEDSTCIGNKYTETNVGLCNDNLTTLDIALFPEDFPLRKSMKYLERHHTCPLDARNGSLEDMNGCFHTCRIFKSRKYGKITLEEIKQRYDTRIKHLEESALKEEI